MRAGSETSRMVGRRRNILNDNLIVTSGFASSHSHGLALTSDGTLRVYNYLPVWHPQPSLITLSAGY